jgi:hypothetical protein
MPRLSPEAKKRSLEKVIFKIKSNEEVAKRNIYALLSDELKAELETERKNQQKLKRIKKPAILKDYEKLHKQALMLLGRYESYIVNSEVITNVLTDRKAKKEELAFKARLALKKAQDYLLNLIKNQPSVVKWLDRDVNLIEKDIGIQHELLPFVITSRSEDKLVDVKSRFGLKTIREMRLEVLDKALKMAEVEIDDWHTTNGYTREDWLTDEEKSNNREKLNRLMDNLKKNKHDW